MAVDAPRILVLLFLLLFLFFSPSGHVPSPAQQRELADQVVIEKQALDVLMSAKYRSFDPANNCWLNLTGFRQDDEYAWHLLPRAREMAEEQERGALGPVLGSLNATDGLPKTNITQADGITIQTEDSMPVFQNVTGILRGRWSRVNGLETTKNHSLNLTALAPDYLYASPIYKRNITGLSGNLRIKFEEIISDELPTDPGMIRDVKAEVLVKDETSNGDGWDIVMHGVHYMQRGAMVFTTTSEKYAGIFALPHLAQSERAFSLSQQLLNMTIRDTIRKQEETFRAVPNPWSSSPLTSSESVFSTAYCEYIMYIQQHPITFTGLDLTALERELRFPQAIPLGSVPDMRMSAVIFSPDCGFILESQGPPKFPPQNGIHLKGPKLETYLQNAKRSIIILTMMFWAQVLLLKRQMYDASTPSAKSRISFYTIAFMAMGDGFACIGFMIMNIFVEALFLPLIAAAFISFVSVSFFGMKFLMDMWSVQASEREVREREQARARRSQIASTNAVDTALDISSPRPPSPSVPSTTVPPDGLLPLPVTARRTTTNTAAPVILPPDQDLDAAAVDDAAVTTTPTTGFTSARREMGALYTKFYLFLLFILFLSLHATSWPQGLRSAYANTLSFIYLSFWCPQIYRNVMRNCRKALSWRFVIGQSLLRLAPFTYLYLYENNVLFVQPDPHALYVLLLWVWIQCWALGSQDVLGPRFFIKEGWAPPAYDYHPILRDSGDGESGSLLPIGFSEPRAQDDTIPAPTDVDTASSSSAIPPIRSTSSSSLTRSHTNEATPRKKAKDGKRIFDCAICTEDVEVPVVSATAESGSGEARSGSTTAAGIGTMVFERRKYMVTPCRHIFHTVCLEGWMRYRLQCPICRESLPPL